MQLVIDEDSSSTEQRKNMVPHGMAGKTAVVVVLAACIAAWSNYVAVADARSIQKATIVLNYRPFASAEKAAAGEESVDWWDADKGDDRACTESFAALELRGILAACTTLEEAEIGFALAEKMPTEGDVFVLGNAESSSFAKNRGTEEVLTDESFRIHVSESDGRLITVIQGKDRVGTLYGVYRYAEELGVRFYGLGERTGERAGKTVQVKSPVRGWKDGKEWTYEVSEAYKVPSKGMVCPARDVELPTEVDIVENPAFLTRGFWAWEDRGNKEFFLWMARNKMNLWTAAEKDVHLLKKLGIKLMDGGHVIQKEFLDPEGEYPYDHEGFEGDEGKPRDPYAIGEGHQGDANGDGKLTYFEAHPEWYGLENGKRVGCFVGSSGANYCTSNEDATRELAKNMIQCLIDGKWRHVDIVNFWMLDDGARRWCECDRCKAKGSFTDRLFEVVHLVSQELQTARKKARLHRNVHISSEAYQETLSPPARALPAGFDNQNVSVTFFPIGRCFVHSLGDAKCTEFNAKIFESLKGWTSGNERHYKGTVFIGEYFNISRLKSLPMVYTSILAEDIPLYYETGARHFHYMHAPTRLWGTWTMNQYLLAKLLWNPKANVEQIAEEYFRKFYPTTSRQMKNVYGQLEFAMANMRLVKNWGWIESLGDKKEEIFKLDHLQFDAYEPELNDGPDIVEMVEAMRFARKKMDAALAQCRDGSERERLAEDEKRLAYGEATVFFCYHIVRVATFYRNGDEDGAREEFSHLQHWAEKLEEVKEMVHVASSHANDLNGLEAMQAPWETNVYEYFKSRYAR